jgi:hypothetical protein
MRRVFIPVVALSVAAALVAHAQAPPPSPPQSAVQPNPVVQPDPVSQLVGMTEDEKAELNRRIRRFEAALRSAVENGGSRLADRAEQVVRGTVQLAMNGAPQINPVYIPGVGYHYDVQVPDILGSSYAMWTYMYKRQQLAVPVGNNPGGKVTGSAAVVAADFDPNTEYAAFVRLELIDAMLESSTVLTIKPEERLIVSARVPADAQVNVLVHNRKIVMQALGSDLIALRQGQLTKDQVKDRIHEFRY